MKQALGYFPLEYWYLFTDPSYGPVLADKHVESLFTALHAEPKSWRETLCAENGDPNVAGARQERSRASICN
jgi:soluble epoxide hydrolase / lipid-phosphate phosphatase